MNVLTVLLLFTAFLITRVSNLRLAIQILIVQSLGVAVACVWSVRPTSLNVWRVFFEKGIFELRLFLFV